MRRRAEEFLFTEKKPPAVVRAYFARPDGTLKKAARYDRLFCSRALSGECQRHVVAP